MKKNLHSPKRTAIMMTIALLVSGVFAAAFLTGCAAPDYSLINIAEHPDDNNSTTVTGGNRDAKDSIGKDDSDLIEPSGGISGEAGKGGKPGCE